MTVNPEQSRIRGRAWRVLKDRFRKRCQAMNAPCWLCGMEIDYNANWRESRAFEADHVLPVISHPHLALTMGNLRPAHSGCNRSRGDKPAVTDWVRPEW